MRPVTVVDTPLAVHFLVKPGAWKWREDMVKDYVDFGGIDEIDGALERPRSSPSKPKIKLPMMLMPRLCN